MRAECTEPRNRSLRWLFLASKRAVFCRVCVVLSLPVRGAQAVRNRILAGGEMVSQGSLEPLFQVRILARQPLAAWIRPRRLSRSVLPATVGEPCL